MLADRQATWIAKQFKQGEAHIKNTSSDVREPTYIVLGLGFNMSPRLVGDSFTPFSQRRHEPLEGFADGVE